MSRNKKAEQLDETIAFLELKIGVRKQEIEDLEAQLSDARAAHAEEIELDAAAQALVAGDTE